MSCFCRPRRPADTGVVVASSYGKEKGINEDAPRTPDNTTTRRVRNLYPRDDVLPMASSTLSNSSSGSSSRNSSSECCSGEGTAASPPMHREITVCSNAAYSPQAADSNAAFERAPIVEADTKPIDIGSSNTGGRVSRSFLPKRSPEKNIKAKVRWLQTAFATDRSGDQAPNVSQHLEWWDQNDDDNDEYESDAADPDDEGSVDEPQRRVRFNLGVTNNSRNSGDPWEPAYEVWYRQGLLAWNPHSSSESESVSTACTSNVSSSHNKLEAELQLASSRSDIVNDDGVTENETIATSSTGPSLLSPPSIMTLLDESAELLAECSSSSCESSFAPRDASCGKSRDCSYGADVFLVRSPHNSKSSRKSTSYTTRVSVPRERDDSVRIKQKASLNIYESRISRLLSVQQSREAPMVSLFSK